VIIDLLLIIYFLDYDVDQFAIEDFLTDFVEDNFYMELEDESQRHVKMIFKSRNNEK